MGLRKALENVGDFLNFLEESRTSETGKEETKCSKYTLYFTLRRIEEIEATNLGAEH